MTVPLPEELRIEKRQMEEQRLEEDAEDRLIELLIEEPPEMEP